MNLHTIGAYQTTAEPYLSTCMVDAELVLGRGHNADGCLHAMTISSPIQTTSAQTKCFEFSCDTSLHACVQIDRVYLNGLALHVCMCTTRPAPEHDQVCDGAYLSRNVSPSSLHVCTKGTNCSIVGIQTH